MFCPQCKAEYRPRFTRCSDCGVDLVYDLPTGQNGSVLDDEGDRHNAEVLRVLWQGKDQGECVGFCLELKTAGIFYRVNQAIEERSTRMQISWKYQIGVEPSEYERARALLGIEDATYRDETVERDDAQEEGCGDPAAELAEGDEASAEEALAEERARSKSYLRDWYPEDATVRVWARDSDGDYSSAIELALKENLIHCRSDAAAHGGREIFVLPEDEIHAKEIIREVIEGRPPK